MYIGTLGFAQVGSQVYDERIKIERRVINSFFSEKEELRVPDEFMSLAHFRWKLCPHDFGSYWDFQIFYDEDEIELLEGENDDKYYRFYDWLNSCESALSDNEEELMKQCEELYQKEITMKVIHKKDEDEEGLKAI